jgi:hypothetical protein
MQESTLKSGQMEMGGTTFAFLLKANNIGKFLRITERSRDAHSSIIIPGTGLTVFKQVLDGMLKAAGEPPSTVDAGNRHILKTESVQWERKHFGFALEKDADGLFLRIIERAGGRDNEIIVPSGGFENFGKLMNEMVKAADENSSVSYEEYMLKNAQLQAGIRTFTLQLKRNEGGRFLRIIQEKEGRLATIIIPGDHLEEFKKLVAEMAKAEKKAARKKAEAKQAGEG